jgi:threonyl-tRNA synthetase
MAQAETNDPLHSMRHSMAHILATAMQELYPGVKFGVGPVIENGFYYDFDLKDTITPEDLPKIEKKMKEVIKSAYPFERDEKAIDDAISYFKEHKQPYKVELLNDLKTHGTTVAKDINREQLGVENVDKVTTVTLYKSGPFTDLCRGGHLENTKDAGAFKLTKVSGAYWRGNSDNPQMQRIYGVAFATEEELKSYLDMMAEAEKRDHRKLGPELGLYMNSELVGAGLPLMMPKGETIKHTLIEYMREKEESLGYQYVSTPVLAHEELYKRSGHATFYADDMYKIIDDENNTFYLKPMNCPHHHMIYERMVQSYRDLPLKLAEGAGLYRKELSGTLTGLIRVRGPITQNDSHIYIEPKDLKAEFLKVLQLFKEVYEETGVKGYWYRLSLPDFDDPKAKFSGDKKVWEEASQAIRESLQEFGAEFVEAEGEAAFYGPKVDVQIHNVTGHEDSIATSQVDVLVPHRMGLKYIDDEGKERQPIIIHRAILGSYERFMAFLIEQTAGNFPVWLAPEQVRLATVSDAEPIVARAKEMQSALKQAGVRAYLDDSAESVGKKIRAASMAKIPYTIVVGEKEVAGGEITPRLRKDLGSAEPTLEFEHFVKQVKDEISSRSAVSGLK